MLWLSFILLVFILFLVIRPKSKKIESFFNREEIEAESFNAVNLKSLVERKKWQKLGASILTTLIVLGPRSSVWASFYVVLSVAASWYIVITLLMIENKALVVGLSCVFIFAGYRSLVTKRRRDFENTFPDALNILMSAVSAGDSLMQAIIYVGDIMDNAIGREFKRMGDRFKLGESPDVILHRACKTYPYPEFLFFTVTIRANIARGGQLKGVLARLIRVLVESRTLEKKKMAMTSEARISAKIVAMIPMIFMVLLNYINPENIDFILHDPSGRVLLYYVVGSEFLGLFIVWLLVKGVRA